MADFPEPEGTWSVPADTALRTVLHRIATELTQTADLASTLQTTLSPIFAGGEQDALAAQDLDRLTQLIEGLATFTAALGERCPLSWQAAPNEAATSLRLQDQIIRLCYPTAKCATSSETGTLELF